MNFAAKRSLIKQEHKVAGAAQTFFQSSNRFAPFLPIIGHFQSDAVRIGEEDGVVIGRVFGYSCGAEQAICISANRLAIRSTVRAVLHSKTEVMQPWCQWIVQCGIMRGLRVEPEMAIEVLDVPVGFVGECVLLEAQCGHDPVVVPLLAFQ